MELDTRPGDLIVFWGSSMYHQRMGAAGSQLLYPKFNALGLDPLGEILPVLPLKSLRVKTGRADATAGVETTASA